MLEAVDCLNGLILLCKSLASELNILYKNNIKMCTFTLEPGVFSVTKARDSGETSVGSWGWALAWSCATLCCMKTDLLQDRAVSAQKRSRSHTDFHLCQEFYQIWVTSSWIDGLKPRVQVCGLSNLHVKGNLQCLTFSYCKLLATWLRKQGHSAKQVWAVTPFSVSLDHGARRERSR